MDDKNRNISILEMIRWERNLFFYINIFCARWTWLIVSIWSSCNFWINWILRIVKAQKITIITIITSRIDVTTTVMIALEFKRKNCKVIRIEMNHLNYKMKVWMHKIYLITSTASDWHELAVVFKIEPSVNVKTHKLEHFLELQPEQTQEHLIK